MSLSREVFYELPEILRHLFRLLPSHNHAFVDVVPKGVDRFLLLFAAVVRFFARVVENVLVHPTTIFALLLPLLPCPLLILLIRPLLLLTASPLLLYYHLFFLLSLLFMLPLLSQLGQGFCAQLGLLEA